MGCGSSKKNQDQDQETNGKQTNQQKGKENYQNKQQSQRKGGEKTGKGKNNASNRKDETNNDMNDAETPRCRGKFPGYPLPPMVFKDYHPETVIWHERDLGRKVTLY